MANLYHLGFITEDENEGVFVWNAWRAQEEQNKDKKKLKPDLAEATLSDMWLLNVNFENTVLSRADLSNTNLIQANLDGANLIGANLQGADLSHASLIGADLRNASLIGAKLQGADLREANLAGADFSGVDIKNADLGNTVFKDTILKRLLNADTCVHHCRSYLDKKTAIKFPELDKSFIDGCGGLAIQIPPGFEKTFIHFLHAQGQRIC